MWFELIAAMMVAGVVTCLSILLLIRFAGFIGLVDDPQGRKQHEKPTPAVGGIGIVLGLMSLYFTLPELFIQQWVVFASVVVLMVVGIIDDLSHIHSAVRILIQIGVGCAIHFAGNLPFLSVGDIWFMGDLGLGPYALTFTCIAVVGGVNAINMMDGLDGLCGLVMTAALSWLSVMAYIAGNTTVFSLALVLLATIAGFLLFNYRFPWNPRARIFLGDSGAYVFGFMIAALFLMASQGSYKGEVQVLTPVTALWLLFIPLIDIAGVIWRRSRVSRWPVDDDREHLHYMLVDRGYSTPQVVNGLFLICLSLAAVGAALFYLGISESWSFVAFMICCTVYFVVTNRMSRGR